MGPRNESASTSQNGPQEKGIPGNVRKDTNMARIAGNSKRHQQKGKFNSRNGYPKQNDMNKHDSIKRCSVPLNQHVKEAKITIGCNSGVNINPGCNDQKRKEGWTNRGGTDEKSISKGGTMEGRTNDFKECQKSMYYLKKK